MAKKARSARGEIVDFDLLAIKQQLATTPVPVGVNARRKFIDEKDGIKTRENFIVSPAAPVQAAPAAPADTSSPLDIAKAALQESAEALIKNAE